MLIFLMHPRSLQNPKPLSKLPDFFKKLRNTHSTHPEGILLLEPLASTEEGAVVEHVIAVGVEAPVAPLTRLLVVTRHLHEALVQGQVVPDRVLPALHHTTNRCLVYQ